MRRGYIDWLRGISVLIMIEAHTLDAWTRVTDRNNDVYGRAMTIAGFAAPSFLFLAGVALALAAGSRLRRGATDAEAAAQSRRRALQILGLAFLFRLQSWIISGGGPMALLKVDILNVMGLAMLAAALLWGFGSSRRDRALWLIAGTLMVALVTPIVRATPILSMLPDPLEWYIRPIPGRGTFTLFPWAGFLLAGTASGLWLDAARTPPAERRLQMALAAIGACVAVAGYATSFLPPMYAQTNFWTTSPTFFFLRLGVLMVSLPLAYAWRALWTGHSVLEELGRASLFVYWIHVELAYGVVSSPLHKRLPLTEALIAYVLFTAALYGAVRIKNTLRFPTPSRPAEIRA